MIDKDKWTNWLKTKGLSDRTIQEYNRYLDRLTPLDLSQEGLLRFITKEYDTNGIKRQGNNNIICRAFLRNLLYYLKIVNGDDNLKQKVSLIEIPKITGRKRKRILNIIDEEELNSIAAHMNSERDIIMLYLSYYAGVRDSELCGAYALKPYSFNWNSWIKQPEKDGKLSIIGKGNKERRIEIVQPIMAKIYQYIRKCANNGFGKYEPIFEIGVRRWTDILHRASQKAIGKTLNPHLLRHSCGNWLYRQGKDLLYIKDWLGHEKINTTQLYIDIKEKLDSPILFKLQN